MKASQNGNKERMHREVNLKDLQKSSLQVNSFATEDPAVKQKGIDKKGSRTDKSGKMLKLGAHIFYIINEKNAIPR